MALQTGRPVIAALAVASLLWAIPVAFAQSGARDTGIEARKEAKALRRPLLRPLRAQFCLTSLGYYDGPLDARPTGATLRALRRYRTDNDIRWQDDVLRDFLLHAALWRRCRPAWIEAEQGRQGAKPGGANLAQRIRATPGEPATAEPSAAMTAAAAAVLGQRHCLSPALKAILTRAHPRRRGVPSCELPCIAPPVGATADTARALEKRLPGGWCRSCVPLGTLMALPEITRIERAGNITLCPDPARVLKPRPSGTSTRTSAVVIDQLSGMRSLLAGPGRGADRHDDVAVVVSNARFGGRLPDKPSAERDGALVAALLTERLGYRPDRLIELRNGTRADFERVLGTRSAPQGQLAERVRTAGAARVLVYVSGYGAIGGASGEAWLLPADAVARREARTAYPLELLFENIVRLDVPATIVLEVDFAADPGVPVIAPNWADDSAGVLPKSPQRNLVVMAAADRGQRPLEDTELGLGLFTRHLVQALAGGADSLPIGNGDGQIDSAEAYVHAAHWTAMTARKVYGVMQDPAASIGPGEPQPLARIKRQ